MREESAAGGEDWPVAEGGHFVPVGSDPDDAGLLVVARVIPGEPKPLVEYRYVGGDRKAYLLPMGRFRREMIPPTVAKARRDGTA